MKKITVKDIAQASGYSVSTVSKALNGTDRVGPEAIEKIKRIAQEMGYRSSFAAQSLARDRRRVAILLPENPPEVRRLFEDGFEAAFDLYREFRIEPWYLLYDPQADDVAWEPIEAEAEAVILIPSDRFQNIETPLMRIGQKKPLVLLQNRCMALSHIAKTGIVTVNARVAGAMAAEFLSLCGSRKAAIITGYQNTWIHQQNISGFLSTAQTYGLQNVAVAESFDDMETAYRLTAALLEQIPELDGIYATSYVAPGVCRRVKEMGRSIHIVGTDLVAGSDDCLRDGILTAAIFQNQAAQARLAAEMVVDVFRQGESLDPHPIELSIKPELVLPSALDCYNQS